MTTDHDPDLIVTGERVALGPLRRELAPTYSRWLNHAEVRHAVEYFGIATPASEEAWVDKHAVASAERQPTTAAFTIYDLDDRGPVGTVALWEISHLYATGMFGILIGERRGQGFGTEATHLMLDWGFHTLGLRNVMLQALAWNGAAIRAYEKAGFRRIGTRRRAAMSRGRRTDVVLMDAVPEDFTGSALAAADDRS